MGYCKNGPSEHPNDMWRVRFDKHGLWAIKQDGFIVLTALDLILEALER